MKSIAGFPEPILLEKSIRDLRWVLEYPLLVKSREATELQLKLKTALDQLWERSPERLYDSLPAYEPKLPLGKWFEKMLYSALEIGFPQSEIYHAVPDGHGGELDFLLADQGVMLHIECAVKFFLSVGGDDLALKSYVGPSGNDRLDLKYEKMRDVQLSRIIPEHFLGGRSVNRILWMAGVIFYPAVRRLDDSFGPMPDVLELNHQRGVYGGLVDVFRDLEVGDRLIKLPRHWWITRLDGFDENILDYFENVSDFESVDGKELVAQIRIREGRCFEISRGFVF